MDKPFDEETTMDQADGAGSADGHPGSAGPGASDTGSTGADAAGSDASGSAGSGSGGGDAGAGAGDAGSTGGDGGTNDGAREGSEHRWPGWGSFAELQDAVGDLVDSAIRNVAPASGRFPRYDLIEVPHEGYRLLFDLPGLTKGDIDVRVQDGEIVVEGSRARPELPEGSEVHRSERAYGRFRRSVRVPGDVDLAAVGARAENGVLHVTLPRRAPADGIKVEVG